MHLIFWSGIGRDGRRSQPWRTGSLQRRCYQTFLADYVRSVGFLARLQSRSSRPRWNEGWLGAGTVHVDLATCVDNIGYRAKNTDIGWKHGGLMISNMIQSRSGRRLQAPWIRQSVKLEGGYKMTIRPPRNCENPNHPRGTATGDVQKWLQEVVQNSEQGTLALTNWWVPDVGTLRHPNEPVHRWLRARFRI